MIINKNILIDTNVIYDCICKNKKPNANMDKLNLLIRKNKSVISIFSIFEIINNKDAFENYLDDIKAFVRKNVILIKSLPKIKKIIGKFNVYDFLDSNSEELLEKRQAIGIEVLKLYASNISFVNSVAFSVYLGIFLYAGNGKLDSRFSKFCRQLANVLYNVKGLMNSVLRDHLSILNKENNYSEKNIKKFSKLILLNIINSIVPYINSITETKEKLSYYEISKYLLEWNSNLNKEILTEENTYTNEQVKKMNILEKLKIYKNKLTTDQFLDSFVNFVLNSFVITTPVQDYTYYYIKKIVRGMFDGNYSIKTNDYIDYTNLEGMVKSPDIDYIITFDKQCLKIMKQSNNEKIKKSVDIIESLIK